MALKDRASPIAGNRYFCPGDEKDFDKRIARASKYHERHMKSTPHLLELDIYYI